MYQKSKFKINSKLLYVNDVISSQICVPGLHISLGLFLKFYELLLKECEELDVKIAFKKAESSSTLPTTSEFDQYVQKLREAISHKKAAEQLRAEIQQVQDHLMYLVTFCGLELSATNLQPNIRQLLQHGRHLLSKAEEEVNINNLSVLLYPTSWIQSHVYIKL